jgi:hypothetical protein
MFTQPVSSAAHRCHWREYDDAVGVQLPFDTLKLSPTTADPLNPGLTVLVGPFFEPITSLGTDVAEALPSALAAVTVTRTV